MPRGVYARKQRSVQTDRPTDRPTDRVSPVSAIDYPGLLAQLEQQDRALVQEREDLVRQLDRLRSLPQMRRRAQEEILMPETQTAPRPLVRASPAPIPLEVICAWLRKKAAAGVPVTISPLLAQRIA